MSALKIESSISESQNTMETLQKDLIGFEKMTVFVRKVMGIDLPTNPKNLTLLASRVTKIMRERNFKNYRQYLENLEKGSPELLKEFVSAMTTNTTHFFRENAHYEVLASHLPSIVQAKLKSHQTDLRIWCAASSTGQEIYTICMVMKEKMPELFAPISPLNLKILSTDIDHQVLKTASQGIYAESGMSGVPDHLKKKYFKTSSQGADKLYQITDDFRKKVRFAPLNLMEQPYPFQHRFDIIFCRNVLIYFDRPTTHSILLSMTQVLNPEGLLFLGHSESGMVRHPDLETVSHAVYKKIPGR